VWIVDIFLTSICITSDPFWPHVSFQSFDLYNIMIKCIQRTMFSLYNKYMATGTKGNEI